MNKKTLIIGATPNSDRYAYKAAIKLMNHGHDVELFGIKKGEINGKKITNDLIPYNDIDTITMYVNPQIQPIYYNYISSLKPARVIFNPGTENPDFEEKLKAQGIEVLEDCTLVLLSMGLY